MKKYIIPVMAVLLVIAVMVSCKKNEDKITPSSSFTIVNGVSGAGILVPNFNATKKLTYYKTAQQIPAYNSATPFYQFLGYMGTYPISVSQFSDTLKSIFSGNVTIEPNSIHSLYLTGPLTAVDTIFTTDKVPAFAPADSLIGIRFINASKGSAPLSINIRNQTTNIVASLPYKGVTEFKPYSAKKTVPATTSYIFEIRDAATARLITSYTLTSLNTRLNRSYTVALRGIPAGTGVNAQAAYLVNNY